MNKFSAIYVRSDKLTAAQDILLNDSEYSIIYDVLNNFPNISFYRIAGEIKRLAPDFKELTEGWLAFGIIRMMQEGLVSMTYNVPLKFKKTHPDAKLPVYQTDGAAGMDVYSVEDIVIGPGNTALVSLGHAVEIPDGWEIQVRPRSGLAAKYDVTVLNSPGTLDSDWRGTNMVILHNGGVKPFNVSKGDRIAQFVVAPAYRADVSWTEELSETKRNDGGFGSTGVR